MKQTTLIIEKVKLERAEQKAKRLCSLYNCRLIDLMILSININAQNKKEQKLN